MILAISLILSAVCFGQSQTQPSRTGQSRAQSSPALFTIGVSEQELFERMGLPARRIGAVSQTRITAGEYSRLRHLAEPYWPLYRRRTANNEYEIMVMEEVDTSRSQLHPTNRVSSVRFQLAKPRTVQQILQEIPEAVRICAQGCEVDTDGERDVIAVPKAGDSVLSFNLLDDKTAFDANRSQAAYVWLMKKQPVSDDDREFIESMMSSAAKDCFATAMSGVRGHLWRMHDLSAKANYSKQLTEIEAKCKARNADSSPTLGKRP